MTFCHVIDSKMSRRLNSHNGKKNSLLTMRSHCVNEMFCSLYFMRFIR